MRKALILSFLPLVYLIGVIKVMDVIRLRILLPNNNFEYLLIRFGVPDQVRKEGAVKTFGGLIQL